MLKNKAAVEYILENLYPDIEPISFDIQHFSEKIVLRIENLNIEFINCNLIKLEKSVIAQLECKLNGLFAANSYFLDTYRIEPIKMYGTGEMRINGEFLPMEIEGYQVMFDFQHFKVEFFAHEIHLEVI